MQCKQGLCLHTKEKLQIDVKISKTKRKYHATADCAQLYKRGAPAGCLMGVNPALFQQKSKSIFFVVSNYRKRPFSPDAKDVDQTIFWGLCPMTPASYFPWVGMAMTLDRLQNNETSKPLGILISIRI